MSEVTPRSARAEVRNPVLGLASMSRVRALPDESRSVLAELIGEVSSEARQRSQVHLARNKWWSAVYWRCIAIYAQHIARAVRRGRSTDPVGEGAN